MARSISLGFGFSGRNLYQSRRSKRDPQGRKRDLSKHSELTSPKGEEEELISKLLLRYLALAVDNAPNSSADDNLMSYGNGRARLNLAQSHFQMLVGVCVEYCVTTKRLDLFIRAHFPTISIGGRYGRIFGCPGTVCARRSISTIDCRTCSQTSCPILWNIANPTMVWRLWNVVCCTWIVRLWILIPLLPCYATMRFTRHVLCF